MLFPEKGSEWTTPSLTATPNHLEGVAQTNHNRTINRRKWNLEELQEVLKSNTPQKKVFESLKQLISLRKKQAAFHPNAKQEILNLGNHLFGLIRTSKNKKQIIILIVNLTHEEQSFSLPEKLKNFDFDLIRNRKIDHHILKPYQFLWITNR